MLVVLLLVAVISACKRTLSKEDVIGNTLVSAPDGFTGIVGTIAPTVVTLYTNTLQPVTATSPEVKFGDYFEYNDGTGRRIYIGDRFFFNNKLSHSVTWYINYKGLSSGAVKSYSGTGNVIDTTVTYWDGSMNGSRFFMQGEQVGYTISFLGSSIKYTGLLKLDISGGIRNYAKTDWDKKTAKILPNGDTLRYFLIDDMADGGVLPGGSITGIRTSYADAADGVGAGKFFVTTKQQVDGHFSYYMIATDINQNTYCGGASGESLTEMYGATSESDASKVYVNAYVYGYGRPNTAISFQAFENDTWNLGDAIPAVRPPANSNDMWYTIVQVDWLGWKLVSIPYSSFKSANNPNSGGGGNRIKEPHKIAGFGIELDSYPNGGSTVELALDAVYLTTNGPFQP